jgi:hypothetical protein
MRYAKISGAVLVVMLWAEGACAQVRAAGYAHGKDHCYHFQAPVGWRMDTRELAGEGVPAIFHPAGADWRSTWNFIYTRPVPTMQGDEDPVRSQIDGMLRSYRADGETLAASRIDTLRTERGEIGQVWEFTGYGHGGRELVVYFEGPRTVNFFVAPIPRQADPQPVRAALQDIATSYRAADDCVPCESAGTCRSPMPPE